MPTTALDSVVLDILQPGYGLVVAKDSERVGHLCDDDQDLGWGLSSRGRLAHNDTSV